MQAVARPGVLSDSTVVVARKLLGARATLVALGLLSGLLMLPSRAIAQTFMVTNTTDSGVAGDGSLRGEVKAANENPGPDSVLFAPGLAGTITFAGAGIGITDSVDIEGPGPAQITVTQTSAHRVFDIEVPVEFEPVTIAGLHLANGTAPSGGGNPGIGGNLLNSHSNLTLANDLITGGDAKTGGGVASFEGPLTMVSSTVSGNHAEGDAGVACGPDPWTILSSVIAGNTASAYDGGLVAQTESTGLIDGSTIAGNTAKGEAGASLSASGSGRIVVRNSTIAGNTASEDAGGLEVDASASGAVAIEDATIAANHAGGNGGGIRVVGSPGLTLADTIVAGNSAGGLGPDIYDLSTSVASAFSLVGSTSKAKLTETVAGSDLLSVDPQLGPLQDNGGPTQTMALAPSSPAVNKGGGTATTDQRGDLRPVAYPGVASSSAPGANGADIGAFELQAPSPPVASLPPASPPPLSPLASARLRVRMSCPKSAKPGGCKFKLEVVAGKPRRVKGKLRRPKVESAVAKLHLAAGHFALVGLKPRPKFAVLLAAARRVLVREVVTVDGSTDTTYRRLKVVR